jgi:hypothetical protein
MKWVSALNAIDTGAPSADTAKPPRLEPAASVPDEPIDIFGVAFGDLFACDERREKRRVGRVEDDRREPHNEAHDKKLTQRRAVKRKRER